MESHCGGTYIRILSGFLGSASIGIGMNYGLGFGRRTLK